MKKYFLIISAFFFVFTACQDVKYQQVAGEAQGTTYHIIYNKDKMMKNEIDSILLEIDLSVSNYNKNSLLYKINKNVPDVTLDQHFITVFNKAVEISKASDGLFDITVGPLINLYGFGTEDKGQISDTLVDSLLHFVGYDKIRIVGNKLEKENENVIIDMNALAQGYSVDYVADYFERKGITNYMIEIGGETICRGHNEFGEAWRIGVEKPLENSDINDRQIELIVGFKNEKKALATSGNYRKFYIENGVKFTHTINPKTGYPSRDSLVSVTIMASDCMTADGYATACLVSGYEKAVEIVNSNDNLEAFLIYFDYQGNYKFYFSQGFKEYVVE
ncbi:MAG: FAD:protein FMN transferase [Bacteroidales bacterium]|nr:FAD:protein FMN transferase [Bacteroidales bacterium]